MDPQTLSQRKRLVDAAIALYLDETQELTRIAVCDAADLDEEVFYAHYDEVDDLLPAFYDLTIVQYRVLRDATTDYEHFTFEERLASFFYIVLDALGEQRTFVEKTFGGRIMRASGFRRAVREELRALTEHDDVPGFNQLVTGFWPIQVVLTEAAFAIIRFWIRDEHPDHEETTALVDKVVSFVAELVTFGGVQRGIDLAWYLAQIDPLGLRRLPVIGRLFGER